MTAAGALVVAWALDAWFGEPRNALHPVAWLGAVLGPVGRRIGAWSPVPAFVGGAVAWLLGAAIVAAAAYAAERAVARLPALAGVPVLAILLKPCFAWRMLRDEVGGVEVALQRSLDDGRARLARLCSRDVAALDADAVRETAIETLAENLNDSVVAPLLWFVVGGLPGAAVYRFANTADAMWGYRGRFEWSGKWAARADDVLSWLPARLTALLLLPGAPRSAWRLLPGEARVTASPNGGWPMGAMALRLGIRLRKPGVYTINGSAPSPGPRDLPKALRLASQVAWAAVSIAVAACLAVAAWT